MSVANKLMPRKQGMVLFFALVTSLLLLLLPSLVEANVDLLYFRATSGTDTITLQWETASELDNLGFNLFRSLTADFGDATRLNANIIPSQVGGQPIGAYYEFPDSNVVPDTVYSYWLEDIDFDGNSELHEPVQASLAGGNTIPTVPPPSGITVTPTKTSTPTATATAVATNPGAGPGPTSTSTRTPVPATTARATPSPTQTVVGTSQSLTQPTATRPPAIPTTATATNNPGAAAYPVPVEVNDSQGGDPVDGVQELAANLVEPTGGALAAVSAVGNNQQLRPTPLSAAPIGGTGNTQGDQNQQNQQNAESNGFPTWLVAALAGGLLMAAVAGAITLLVVKKQTAK